MQIPIVLVPVGKVKIVQKCSGNWQYCAKLRNGKITPLPTCYERDMCYEACDVMGFIK